MIGRWRRRKTNRRVQPRARLHWRPAAKAAGVVASAALLVGPLAWGYGLLHDPARFPVRQVQVEGAGFQWVEPAAIRDAVAPFVGAGFFNVDVRAVRRAVSALPWVDRCSVRRAWPDGLYVQVSEQRPLARWDDAALLNVRGEVFRPAAERRPTGLARLAGPEGLEKTVAGMYREVSRALAPLEMEVARLRLDARRSWHLEVAGGIELELGRNEPYRRLTRFLRVYPRLLAGQDAGVERVDLRYTNGFAVSWKTPPGADATSGS